MASDIKTFHITGGSDVMGGRKSRKTRKTRGGADNNIVKGVSDNMMIVKGIEQQSVASSAGSTDLSRWLHIEPQVPKIQPTPSYIPQLPSAPLQMNQLPHTIKGGVQEKIVRVELKKHSTPKRVHLAPKKFSQPALMLKKDKKKTRKVTVGLVSMHKRVTRARKIRDKVKSMKYDELKAFLIRHKLIKPTSNAPESILRQIAQDAQIVAGKGL